MPANAATRTPRNLAASTGTKPARKTGRSRRAHRFRRLAVADQDDRVRPRQAGPDRFAQWSGRNEAAIAESVFGVDDDERQVLGDPRVLKPVVEHDDFGAGRRCFAASGGPVARDPARPAFAPAATLRRRPPRRRAASDRRAPVRRAARHSRASRHAPRAPLPAMNSSERKDDRRLSRARRRPDCRHRRPAPARGTNG